MKADLTDQGLNIPGVSSWLLTVTNTSGKPCRLYGFPSFGLKSAAGEGLPDSRTDYQRHPGEPLRFTLKPGRSGWAGVKWRICPQGDLTLGLVLTPPGEWSHTDVNLEHEMSEADMQKVFRPCNHTVTAGTLQPSNQGVIFTLPPQCGVGVGRRSAARACAVREATYHGSWSTPQGGQGHQAPAAPGTRRAPDAVVGVSRPGRCTP